ncbi:MAG TPA: HD domain-containing protein, partial [Armatimonadota bacterium]|nr:HD domain-containing protein [Armatimonadota bacterium]
LGAAVRAALRAPPGQMDMGALRSLAARCPALRCLRDCLGVIQGGHHRFDVFEHSVHALTRLEEVSSRLIEVFPATHGAVEAYLRAPGRRSALRLATLLHDVGKPARRTPGQGRYRFFGHEHESARLVEDAAAGLGFGVVGLRTVVLLVRNHMRPPNLADMRDDGTLTERALRRLGRDMGSHLPGLMALFIADAAATRDLPILGPELAGARELAEQALAARAAPAPRPRPPVTGNDLMEALDLEPGPQVGRLLGAVERAWARGQIQSREDALDLARSLSLRRPQV